MSRELEYTKEISLPERTERDGFEYPHGIPGLFRLLYFSCEGKRYSISCLVKHYAMMGLHRYNLLEGKNFQFDFLKGFSMRANCGANSYYIALAAFLPDSGLQQNFQVLVREERLCTLDLTCRVARPQVTTKSSKKDEPVLRPHRHEALYDFLKIPDWPSETAFNDRKRFYLVKESELRETDWIRLYLQLVLVTCQRDIPDDDLSQLEIVQVAIETIEDMEPPNARLNAKTAVVYIAYKDFAKARMGESLDRKAIVKRIVDESTGKLTLRGDYWSEEKGWDTETEPETASDDTEPETEPDTEEKAYEQRSKKKRLGVHKLWRLSDPRWHRAYKSRG